MAAPALKPINKKREQKQHDAAVEAERQRLESYEDLRDDVVSLVRNSHLTDGEIHGKLGPHPSTLKAWAEKTVRMPQLRKMQATLRIIGYDIGVIPHQRERLQITKMRLTDAEEGD